MVEVAAPLTSCFRWQSKHSMTRLRLLFHSPSNRCINELPAEEGCSGLGSSRARGVTFGAALGAEGEKCEPHWRHIVVFAAAYSCCLKPQCGHSTLTLTGDDFATVSLRKAKLCPCPECCLYRLLVTNHVRACMRHLGTLGIPTNVGTTGDFRFPNKGRPFFNHETRRF